MEVVVLYTFSNYYCLQLNSQYDLIQFGFLVDSPSFAHVGQLTFESAHTVKNSNV